VDLSVIGSCALALIGDFEVAPLSVRTTLGGVMVVSAAIYGTASARGALAPFWRVSGQLLLLTSGAALSYYFRNRYSFALLIGIVTLVRMAAASHGARLMDAARLGALECRVGSYVSIGIAATSLAIFTLPDAYWMRPWPAHTWRMTSLIAGLGTSVALLLAGRRFVRVIGGVLLGAVAILLNLSTPFSGWGVASFAPQAAAYGPILAFAVRARLRPFQPVRKSQNRRMSFIG
jgi:hypothetical protein